MVLALDRLPPHVHVPMIPDCRHTILFILSLCAIRVIASVFGESFQEELVLRPERDGRVVSRFAFMTLLSGASPRDPETLGLEDHCAYLVENSFDIF